MIYKLLGRHTIHTHIYIYIYMCVCVCVCKLRCLKQTHYIDMCVSVYVTMNGRQINEMLHIFTFSVLSTIILFFHDLRTAISNQWTILLECLPLVKKGWPLLWLINHYCKIVHTVMWSLLLLFTKEYILFIVYKTSINMYVQHYINIYYKICIIQWHTFATKCRFIKKDVIWFKNELYS